MRWNPKPDPSQAAWRHQGKRINLTPGSGTPATCTKFRVWLNQNAAPAQGFQKISLASRDGLVRSRLKKDPWLATQKFDHLPVLSMMGKTGMGDWGRRGMQEISLCAKELFDKPALPPWERQF